MANAKAAAKDEQSIVDRMSNLPDDVLRPIFSSLPSHSTIRLSSLSSRYRYLWRSVPALDFLDNYYPMGTFEKVMKKALKHHENLDTIRRFRLRCYNSEYKEFLISNWIDLSTSCSNLQVFDIHLAANYRVTLTCETFSSCPKLERISLSGGIVVGEIPTDTRVFLPCVKSLRFRRLRRGGVNALNKLLFGCPRIETFDVEDCDHIKKLYIKYHYHLKPSKTKEDGGSNLSLTYACTSDEAGDVLNLICGTVNQLEMCTNEDEIYKNNGEIRVVTWKNLTHTMIKVSMNLNGFQSLSTLLEHSPMISLGLKKFSLKLETVKIKGIDGPMEMEIVEYFLSRAVVLKKLVIGHYYQTREIKEKIEAMLVNQRSVSSHCKIEFHILQPVEASAKKSKKKKLKTEDAPAAAAATNGGDALEDAKSEKKKKKKEKRKMEQEEGETNGVNKDVAEQDEGTAKKKKKKSKDGVATDETELKKKKKKKKKKKTQE